ncbi:MAG: tetratricopeptide repeat protein, partial [Candidatus Hodarchaeota archaeon]
MPKLVYKAEKELLDNNINKAMKLYYRALEKFPRSFHLLHDLYVIYNETEQKEDALETYKKITEIKPKTAIEWRLLSIIYVLNEEFEKAKE